MKHSLKVTIIILCMFVAAQFIGLYVASFYSHSGNVIPLGLSFSSNQDPFSVVFQLIISLIIAILLILGLMKLRAEIVMRIWFFVVVTLALIITLNALFSFIPSILILSFIAALVIAYYKIIKRNIIIHNLSELFVYPGIAAIFIPVLSIYSAVALLIIISLYDMYAVWKAGFMQKMAKYQIKKVKIFTGFLVPYLTSSQRRAFANAKTKSAKKKIKISLAMLGGGDVVFPIIMSGVVLYSRGLVPALFVTIGAFIGLGALLYNSEKGKFYPAMPFITLGCLLGLALQFLL